MRARDAGRAAPPASATGIAPDLSLRADLALSGLFQLHLGGGAVDRAPILVFGKRHPAFDAHADSRLRWVVFSEQTLQKGHAASQAIRIDTLDGSGRFPVVMRAGTRIGTANAVPYERYRASGALRACADVL